MVVSHIFPVTVVAVNGSIDSSAGAVVIVDVMVALVVGVGTGRMVSVSPPLVTVCNPDKVSPGGSVSTTEDPSGSVNVSTFEVDTDGGEDTLDVIDIGSTVNTEPDMVRVSSSVTEALTGSVTVAIGPSGSVTVCMIKDVDSLDFVDTIELEPVERDAVFGADGRTGPLELIAVLERCVLEETDDSGEVDGLILPLGLLVVDLRVDGELGLAGVLEDTLCIEEVDETTVEAITRELLQIVVAFGTNEELPGGTY